MWCEVFEDIQKNNKHELSIHHAKLITLLESNNGKVDKGLFKLNQLNFLQLTNSHMLDFPNGESLSDLSKLQQLHLYGNLITSLPGVESLSFLKVLDVSDNNLTEINLDFTNSIHLSTVNLSNNKISSCIIKSNSIHILNLSMNLMVLIPTLPASIVDLNLSKNNIKEIPDTVIQNGPNIKILDLSDNQISFVPKTLASIKFKTFNLKGNPLKDKKLHKFVEQNTSMNAIMSHIQKLGVSSPIDKIDDASESSEKAPACSENNIKSIVIKKFDEKFKIVYDMSVKNVRGFILCCIVSNLQFSANTLKEFLKIQTKLHETLCKKRELATIATHDMDLVTHMVLRYAAKKKESINIHPLNKSKSITCAEYFDSLKREAELIRKEKKRSSVSGVYKFLDLLKDKEDFAFLEVAETQICISLPPITNSEVTKMSINTKRLLLEVTSNANASICYKVMSEMIQMLIQLTTTNEALELQQVRILNSDETLKTLYPSKNDLKELENEVTKITHG